MLLYTDSNKQQICENYFLFLSLSCPEMPETALKVPNKNCSRRHFFFIYFSLSKEIRLDFHVNHMKYQALFSLKNNEKAFINVVCLNSATYNNLLKQCYI